MYCIHIIYNQMWVTGPVGLWANKALAPRASHCASAVSVYVILGKNPLCQNSFPAQEN